jgi:receptor protein-tyrosine kinase
VADALLIGVHVDAVVVVARLGQTTRDRVRRTTTALTQVKANVAGVVPNGAIERVDSAYSYAYRDSSKRPQPDSRYQAPDPVVAPHPNNLHPAFRANGKAHEPSKPDGALVESSAPKPLGKHAAPERGPETDAPAPPAAV